MIEEQLSCLVCCKNVLMLCDDNSGTRRLTELQELLTLCWEGADRSKLY